MHAISMAFSPFEVRGVLKGAAGPSPRAAPSKLPMRFLEGGASGSGGRPPASVSVALSFCFLGPLRTCMEVLCKSFAG
eukprot:8009089-Pyramimonas_sp.AAC.1